MARVAIFLLCRKIPVGAVWTSRLGGMWWGCEGDCRALRCGAGRSLQENRADLRLLLDKWPVDTLWYARQLHVCLLRLCSMFGWCVHG